MTVDQAALELVISELQTAIALPKCQKCGCMQEALSKAVEFLPSTGTEAGALRQAVMQALPKMLPVQYKCLGCEYCYAGVIENNLGSVYPAFVALGELTCEFCVREDAWFPIAGVYHFRFDHYLGLIKMAGFSARRVKSQSCAM